MGASAPIERVPSAISCENIIGPPGCTRGVATQTVVRAQIPPIDESKKAILASAAHEQVPAMSLLCARSTGPEQRVSARPVEQHCPSAAGGCQRVGHSP